MYSCHLFATSLQTPIFYIFDDSHPKDCEMITHCYFNLHNNVNISRIFLGFSYLFWEIFVSFAFFKLHYLFSCSLVVWVSYIFLILYPSLIYIYSYFLLIFGLPLHSIHSFFCCAETFQFDLNWYVW